MGLGDPPLLPPTVKSLVLEVVSIVYVIFFFKEKKKLFNILKVLLFLPQTLKKLLDVGHHPHLSLSSK